MLCYEDFEVSKEKKGIWLLVIFMVGVLVFSCEVLISDIFLVIYIRNR